MTIKEIRDDLIALGLLDNIELAMLIYMSVATRKTKNKISFLITGPAGLGKSYLAKQVLSLFPDEDIVACSRMTPAALTRQGDLSDKILFIQEKFKDSQYAQYIRQLISEGEVVYTTVNDEYKLRGPTTLIETTIDPGIVGIENNSRCFVVRINTSGEAKSNILDKQKAGRTLEGLLFQSNLLNLREKHRAFQDGLDYSLDVMIPFSKSIYFQAMPHHATRMLDRALNVISAITCINQKQRQVKEIEGFRYVEATEEDFNDAKRLLVRLELEEDEHEIPFESVKLAEDLLLNRERLNDSFSRSDLLSVLNKRFRTFKPIKKRLDPLIEAGFINVTKQGGYKNGYKYELDSDFMTMNPEDLTRNSYAVLSLS